MRQEPDDVELIRKFKKGDILAFDQLVLKYQDKIYGLCRYMLGNAHDAEDAAQDTFIKAYRNLNHFRPDASFYTWLYRIAANTCLDYKKRPFFESIFKSSDEDEDFFQEPVSDEPSPEKMYEDKQLGLVLRKGLGKLSSKLRVVIILKEIEGLSYEEIAEVLEVSVGTVKSRISRAREELKKILKKFREQN
jgi:RNA polymerase sigma-70 factor (ECF subfamily)